MWKLSEDGRIDRLYVFKHLGTGYVPVGVLAFAGAGRRRQGSFAYAPSYLARRTGRPIDPIALPLGPRWKVAHPEEVPLAFHDSGPDGWGKGLLDMAYPGVPLGMAEYLASGGARRTGDLAYGPTPDGPAPWRPERSALMDLPQDEDDLEALLAAAKAAEEGAASTGHLALLLRGSSGLGGARPKARLHHEGADWIAKFPAWGDSFDDPRVEAACLDAAEAAGIVVPERRVLTVRGRSILLVRRFDRDAADGPVAYLSAGTLLGQPSVDYNTTRTYVDIALVGRQVGAAGTLPGMFRRFLLNALIRNTDDHLRNHGFIDAGGGWGLSPAFDLVPHIRGLRHVCAPAAGVGPEWDPGRAHATHHRFGVPRGDASSTWDEVVAAVRRLPEFMDARGVARDDRALVLGALAERGGPMAVDGWAVSASRPEAARAVADGPGPGTPDGLESLVVTRAEVAAALALRARDGGAACLAAVAATWPAGTGEDGIVPFLAGVADFLTPASGVIDEATGDGPSRGERILAGLRDGFGRARNRVVGLDLEGAAAGLPDDASEDLRRNARIAFEAAAGRIVQVGRGDGRAAAGAARRAAPRGRTG